MRFDLLPEKFVISVNAVSDRGPLEGVSVDVRLLATRKNPFCVQSAASDRYGLIHVTRSELLESAMCDMNAFPMDYVHPSEGLSGIVELRPLSGVHLHERLDFYLQNRRYYRYPSGFESLLRNCIQAVSLVGSPVEVQATADLGSPFTVRSKVTAL